MHSFFMTYIVPILIVAIGLALPMAFILAALERKFEAESQGEALKIRENLPGINCGACGYAGCAAFAEALLRGDVGVEKCRPSKPEGRENISRLLSKAEGMNENGQKDKR